MATLKDILDLLPSKKRASARGWRVYSMTWLPLVASAAATKQTLTTQDDSDFIAMRIKAYCTTNATPPVENATPQATFTLQIGTQDYFPVNNNVHLQTVAVSVADRRGHELEYPIYIPAQNTLAATMANLTATDIMIRMYFYGIVLYNRGQSKNDL